MRSAREALSAFRRSPLLGGLSVSAVALSLMILGLFALTAHNIDRVLTGVEERVGVVAYLIDDAGDQRIDAAQREIEAYPEVEEVRFVTKTEALVNARRELDEFSEVYSDLEVNPLPASFDVRLREAFRNPEHLESVAQRLSGYPFVEEVRFGREEDWLGNLFALRRIAGGAAAVLGGAFAITAILLIGTSVRMAILSRSDEIDIMQTVGATEAYIQRPFVVEGLITGLLGGLVALGLTRLAHSLIVQNLLIIDLEWIPDLWVALGIATAAALGMLAAAYSVRRELGKAYAY